MRRRLLAAAVFLAYRFAVGQVPPQPPPPAVSATVEVVATTPVDGVGVPLDRFPANVQLITGSRSLTTANALTRQGTSVTTTESQTNRFQPDIAFRGFLASALLGTPQGIAVFQDGVRLNEPFGDVVNWDVLPHDAIASAQIIPGSNAAFGLNALGGVIALRTKTGFADPGVFVDLGAGSFGSRSVDVSSGGSHADYGYFLALGHDEESGWRDFAPSRIDHLFASLQRAGEHGSADVRLTLADTALTGNGTAPIQLLAERRPAVFTYPDNTRNRFALLSTAYNATTSGSTIDLNGYVRSMRSGTMNGDESPYERCAGDSTLLCDGGSGELIVDGAGEPFHATAQHPLDAVLNRIRIEEITAGAAAQLTRSERLFRRDHQVAIGASFDRAQADLALDTELADFSEARRAEGIGRVAADGVVRLGATISHAALFATDVVNVSNRSTITAALRLNESTIDLHDHAGNDLSGAHHFTSLNPSLGATFALTSSVTTYASLGQSSRTPTPVELTCANPDDPCRLPNAFVSDPPLAQVVARSLEAGLRGRTPHSQWSIAAYQTENDDDIIFVSSGRQRGHGYFANVGRTRRAGVEMMAGGSVAGRFDWRVSYSLLHATFRDAFVVASPNNPSAENGEIGVEAGDTLPLTPKQTLKLSGTVRLNDAIRFDVDARSVSASFFRGDEANVAPPLAGYVTADADLTVMITRRVAIEARATNVTNARYATFGTFGDATEILGDGYGDKRFVSPGQPRAFELVLRFTGAR
jgi:iron complex outermembrane receptor protein